jgi:hypothetical protein
MKTSTMLAILWICALLLTACGAPARSTSGFRSGSSAFRTLTPEAKLALGVLKLEGTPQAIDPTGAAKLLPLWQLLAQLNGSSSSAPQEVTAVLDAIRANMGPGQVQAIDAMKLTGADVGAVFQQLGGSGGSRGTGSSSSGTTNRGGGGGGAGFFFGGGGGGPGGGIPGAGGGGGGFRAAGGTTASGTPAPGGSTSTTPSFTNSLSITLVNQVIQLLKSKVPA